jgi:hypothetical protein
MVKNNVRSVFAGICCAAVMMCSGVSGIIDTSRVIGDETERFETKVLKLISDGDRYSEDFRKNIIDPVQQAEVDNYDKLVLDNMHRLLVFLRCNEAILSTSECYRVLQCLKTHRFSEETQALQKDELDWISWEGERQICFNFLDSSDSYDIMESDFAATRALTSLLNNINRIAHRKIFVIEVVQKIISSKLNNSTKELAERLLNSL